ncbi:MAG: hypothetical protein PWR12_2090 [Eubacteriaceae bacterium]|nr:hypothetical protein [Eubacteriaceae bacterium]MDK2961859.1 hypothetical protein [Eubacteriaceae bacterium]
MAKKGWISLHRSIQDNWIWEDKPFDRRSAWIDILLMVNHEKKKIMLGNQLIEVERGEKITSLRKLSDRWGWSITKTNSFLNMLEADGMIIQKKDTKKTVLKVLNYDVYQDKDKDEKDSKMTPKRHDKDTDNFNNSIYLDENGKIDNHEKDSIESLPNPHSNGNRDVYGFSESDTEKTLKRQQNDTEKTRQKTNNNVNNANNVNNKNKGGNPNGLSDVIFSYSDDPDFRNTIKDFVEMRKKNRKNMTVRALELMLKKLDALANDDKTKIAIINQSIENCWMGIFPLKGSGKQKPETMEPISESRKQAYVDATPEFAGNLWEEFEVKE